MAQGAAALLSARGQQQQQQQQQQQRHVRFASPERSPRHRVLLPGDGAADHVRVDRGLDHQHRPSPREPPYHSLPPRVDEPHAAYTLTKPVQVGSEGGRGSSERESGGYQRY